MSIEIRIYKKERDIEVVKKDVDETAAYYISV